MASRYYEIAESEMDSLLLQKGFEEVKVKGTKEKVYSFEHPKHPGFGIRVFSSIKDGSARGCGKDAIRCVYWSFDYSKPIGKTRRINRIKTWEKNLLRRLRKMAGMLGIFKEEACCPDCGAPVVRRKSKYGHFYGCVAYPACKGTISEESLKGKFEDREEKVQRMLS